MLVNISKLPDGRHHYRFDDRPDAFREETGLTGFQAGVILDKAHDTFLFTLQVNGSVELSCDRCLEQVNLAVNETTSVVYRPDGDETLDPDVKPLSRDQNIIDLTPDVVDTIRLAIPMKVVCSETCKGLCPSCGVNLNQTACGCSNDTIDPRWENLLKLKNN
ncbi:MAG: DUF177 domain-containing protein [Bacteroidetes bacterium]|nr:DUF177 domain-containing protein [Bacteroidota bacterium]